MLILQLKHKYLEVEDRLKEKTLNDHYIDVLKAKVEELQEKNHSLNAVIQQQQ
jgi:hypothetical protein